SARALGRPARQRRAALDERDLELPARSPLPDPRRQPHRPALAAPFPHPRPPPPDRRGGGVPPRPPPRPHRRGGQAPALPPRQDRQPRLASLPGARAHRDLRRATRRHALRLPPPAL